MYEFQTISDRTAGSGDGAHARFGTAASPRGPGHRNDFNANLKAKWNINGHRIQGEYQWRCDCTRIRLRAGSAEVMSKSRSGDCSRTNKDVEDMWPIQPPLLKSYQKGFSEHFLWFLE
jgi:hypothetical protein